MDLSMLNPPQKEAVMHTEGPLLVLAGAGSGKTRVLTHRIAYLIEACHAAPYSILALTFTNKAAQEMKSRVEALTGDESEGIWVMTFHSFCVRILRAEIDRLGYDRSFVIYDDSDQVSLMKKLIRDHSLNPEVFKPRNILSEISRAKNFSLDARRYLAETRASSEIISLFNSYQKELKKSNSLDFDDLLVLTNILFEEYPEVLEKYQDRFRYILVDEYQDTNMTQYRIVEKLSEKSRNLCVVGDDDQSIYGWRGADIRNILEFERDFPGAAVIRLEQNYRSTGNILRAANLVIANNRGRKSKKLWTDQPDGAPVSYRPCATDQEEAMYVCSEILRNVTSGYSLGDIAVLYRTHAQSRILEMHLKNYGIPYRIYGGLSFFQRAEVKDILSYLRLTCNPYDNVSFYRAINVPKRGIGPAAVSALESYAAERNLPLLTACMMLEEGALGKYEKKFRDFSELILQAYGSLGTVPLADAVRMLLQKIGYDSYLRDDKKENYEVRSQIVEELVGFVDQFASEYEVQGPDVLQAFLENAALYSATDDLDDTAGAVTLMTLHSAKGLEFPVVYLTGMENGVFPSERSLYESDRLEEERRLCYVGVTRAKRELHLSGARERFLYGSASYFPPSVFLREMEQALPEGALEPPRPVRRQPADSPAFGSSPTGRFPAASAAGGSLFGNRTSDLSGTPARKAGSVPVPDVAPGSRVLHKVFGPGTVVSITGTGANAIAEIAFDSGAIKKIAVGYGSLSIPEEGK